MNPIMTKHPMLRSTSDKIRVASFIATILVVFRHAVNLQAFGVSGVASFIENGCSFMTDVAVPFFFMASGFFFFRYSYGSVPVYLNMLKKKISTLLLPFLIWNLVGALVLLIYDKHGMLGDSFGGCLYHLFMSHWYGPLWYVRDIMIMMALVPLYGWIVDKKLLFLHVAAICLIAFRFWAPGWVTLLTGEGITFFLLGGLILHFPSILEKRIPNWITLILLAVWIYLSFFVTVWDNAIHKSSILVGLVSFWFSLDILPRKIYDWGLKLSSFSFLIYVTHANVLKFVKVVMAHYFEGNEAVALLAFAFVPLAVVLIIVGVGSFWKKQTPDLYNLCIGGRS